MTDHALNAHPHQNVHRLHGLELFEPPATEGHTITTNSATELLIRATE